MIAGRARVWVWVGLGCPVEVCRPTFRPPSLCPYPASFNMFWDGVNCGGVNLCRAETYGWGSTRLGGFQGFYPISPWFPSLQKCLISEPVSQGSPRGLLNGKGASRQRRRGVTSPRRGVGGSRGACSPKPTLTVPATMGTHPSGDRAASEEVGCGLTVHVCAGSRGRPGTGWRGWHSCRHLLS